MQPLARRYQAAPEVWVTVFCPVRRPMLAPHKTIHSPSDRDDAATMPCRYTGSAVALNTVLSAKEECICATPGRRARCWR